MFSVTAFMCVYNEADILPFVLRHLGEQGVRVHIIDNWSTDGSSEIAREFPLVGYEKFPVEGPSPYYSWKPLLQQVELRAMESKASWCVHHDADEIRRSCRNETLAEGFERVEKAGFNAVNHQVYAFRPIDNNYKGDPEEYFKYYTLDQVDCRMRQVKAWKNFGQRVGLSENGGHFAGFKGIQVSPEKFILKHYPMRTAEQAYRKIIKERMERYDPAERKMDWHVQYNGISKTKDWICTDPSKLTLWGEKRPCLV